MMKKKKNILFIFSILIAMGSSSFALEGGPVSEVIDNELIPAIQEKTMKWNSSIKNWSDADGMMRETVEAMNDTRAEQVEIARQSVLENPPDLDGSLNMSTVRASKWGAADEQSKDLKGYLSDINAYKASKIESSLTSSDNIFERIFYKMEWEKNNSENQTEEEAVKKIELSLTNPSVLYYPKTYGESETESPYFSVEQQFLDAVDFTQLLINPYNKGKMSYDALLQSEKSNNAKAGSLSEEARVSLAQNAVSIPLAMRTKVEGGGLGIFLREYMESLNEKSKQKLFSDEMIAKIPDDVSRYEFMDTLFAVIPLNPAWHIALEGMTPKAIQRTKVELRAFLNLLEWENNKMLEQLLSVNNADSAISIEK